MKCDRIDRRTLLASCCAGSAAALAGCSILGTSGDEGSAEPGGGEDSADDDAADDGSVTETMPASSLGDAGWRHPHFSARRTGYNPAAEPPTSAPTQRWSRELAARPLVADDHVHVCGEGRLDAGTGESQGAPADCPSTLAAIGDGVVYEYEDVGSADGDEVEVRAVEVASGSPRWRAPIASAMSVTVTQGSVIVRSRRTSSEGSIEPIHVLETDSGDLRWERLTEVGARARRVLAATGDAVFAYLQVGDPQAVDGEEPRLRAFDLETGDRLWEKPSLPVEAGTVAGGRLFTTEVRGDEHVLRARDAGSGAEQWRVDPTEGIDGIARPALAPTLTNDHLLVPVGGSAAGSADRLRAFSREAGDLEWDRSFGTDDLDAVGLSAPVAASGRIAVCGTEDGSLLGLDATSGEERWRTDAGLGRLNAVALAGEAVFASRPDAILRFD